MHLEMYGHEGVFDFPAMARTVPASMVSGVNPREIIAEI